MFIHDYKPALIENIVGNSTTIKSILTWLNEWYITSRDVKNTCALLSGPNGIGKTLTIELIIQQMNLVPIPLNPHEAADKEYIIKTILPAIKRTKSFTNKQNIFVIHDIDCYDDYGFISSIVMCLKETKIPVIATCNNRYDQSLKPILNYCLDMKFQKPSSNEISKFLKAIIKKENISITDAKLNQLIEDSNNDIRSIMNNLQFYNSSHEIEDNKCLKDKTINNIFEVTKLFMSQNLELHDKQILFWMNHEILPLMIHENYPMNNIKMKNEVAYLNNIASSVHSLSDIDLFEKNIHTNGNWELMPYTALFSIKSVANCHAKTMIKFTSFFEKRVSKKQTMNKNNMDSISVNNVKKKPVKKTTSSKKSEKKTVKAEKQPRKTTKIKQISSENQEKPKIVRKKKHILIIEE
jgi:replication factor C subunit 1